MPPGTINTNVATMVTSVTIRQCLYLLHSLVAAASPRPLAWVMGRATILVMATIQQPVYGTLGIAVMKLVRLKIGTTRINAAYMDINVRTPMAAPPRRLKYMVTVTMTTCREHTHQDLSICLANKCTTNQVVLSCFIGARRVTGPFSL